VTDGEDRETGGNIAAMEASACAQDHAGSCGVGMLRVTWTKAPQRMGALFACCCLSSRVAVNGLVSAVSGRSDGNVLSAMLTVNDIADDSISAMIRIVCVIGWFLLTHALPSQPLRAAVSSRLRGCMFAARQRHAWRGQRDAAPSRSAAREGSLRCTSGRLLRSFCGTGRIISACARLRSLGISAHSLHHAAFQRRAGCFRAAHVLRHRAGNERRVFRSSIRGKRSAYLANAQTASMAGANKKGAAAKSQHQRADVTSPSWASKRNARQQRGTTAWRASRRLRITNSGIVWAMWRRQRRRRCSVRRHRHGAAANALLVYMTDQTHQTRADGFFRRRIT